MAIPQECAPRCNPPRDYCENPAIFAWWAPLSYQQRTHYRCAEHRFVTSGYPLVDAWSGLCYRHWSPTCDCYRTIFRPERKGGE